MIQVIPEWSSSFPHFLQLNSEFCNKEFSIWATVSSQSYFCWLYRASLSLTANNTINLISVLTIWWYPSVQLSRVVGRVSLLWLVHSLGKTVSLCPASFCTPRPNLPVTPGISWLPTFVFQSPMMKRTFYFFFFFYVLVLESHVGLHRIVQLKLLWHFCLGQRVELLWYWMVCLGSEPSSFFCPFGDCTQVMHFRLFFTMRATPFLLRNSCPQ